MSQLNIEYIPPPSGQFAIDIAYSATSSSGHLKRKRSELPIPVSSLTMAVCLDESSQHQLPIILPDIHDEPYDAPPSPVPTEIIEITVEESCEERMEAAKAMGVKVRDFAYEPVPQGSHDPRAPEVWEKPLQQLIFHDRYIRRHPTASADMRLPGKVLYHLRNLGWVTQREAEDHWRPEDQKAVSEYVERPNGPYPVCIPKWIKKPTAAYRAALRNSSFTSYEDDIPEECIYVPPDVPGMDNGPARIHDDDLRLARPTLRAAAASPAGPGGHTPAGPGGHTPAGPGGHTPDRDVHADKRRRVSTAAEVTPPASPVAGPSRAPGRTLSRSVSVRSLDGSSRSTTPPVEEVPPPPRHPRALRRNLTMASIPVR